MTDLPADWGDPAQDITLRDRFAGQALPALIETRHRCEIPWEDVATVAYEVADAMLEARAASAGGGE